MESDLFGVYTCQASLADKSIISNDFQLPNDTKSYFYIKIFVDVFYSEVATEFIGSVLVSFDELLNQDPSDEEYSSALYTTITSLYARLIYRPRLWRYINDSVYKAASNIAQSPQNSGLKILPLIISLSVKDFIEEDPEEDSEEEEDSIEEEIGDLEEDYMDTDLDWAGPKGRPASEGSVAALESMSIRDRGDRCVICYEQFEIGSIAMRMPCMHVYHGDCLSEWLNKTNSCPLCRFELPTDDTR